MNWGRDDASGFGLRIAGDEVGMGEFRRKGFSVLFEGSVSVANFARVTKPMEAQRKIINQGRAALRQ